MNEGNNIRRAFRTTKIKIDTLDAQSQQELEQLFFSYEAAKTDAVTAERAAGKAVNQATIRRSNAQIAEISLLETAANYFSQIAGDRVWIAYRDKSSGVITFEGFTERLFRNNLRAQQAMLGDQLASNAENASDSGPDLYESEEDEESNS